MSKTTIGILRGGPSSEYDISLKSGSHIMNHFRNPDFKLADRYSIKDVYVDKDGTWHIDGLPVSHHMIGSKVDVIFNLIHGEYGEDGKVQNILHNFSIPYIGSEAFPSFCTLNKSITKKLAKDSGIKTPLHKEIELKVGDDIDAISMEIFRNFPMPVVVKPAGLGSSLGITLARSFDELVLAINHALGFSKKIIIEEYISGKEAVSGFIDDFRGESVYILIPVEILKPERKIHDWASKHSGIHELKSPGNFSEEEKKKIHEAVRLMRSVLGLKHFASMDFIVHPKRGVYLIEVDSVPALHEYSPIYKSLESSGTKVPDFLTHLVDLALKRK